MKASYKSLFILIASLFTATANAGEPLGDASVAAASMTRNGNLMTTVLDLELNDVKVKSNQAVVFTPMIVNGADTLQLEGAAIYGRTRWYQFMRAGKSPLSGAGEKSLRYDKDLKNIVLEQNVPFGDWMNGSTLQIVRQDYGCAGCDLGPAYIAELTGYAEPVIEIYQPDYIFAEAIEEEVKTREIAGRAYVDFPVNKIVIYPDYRNNTYELGKIIATIDSVKNDKDITVTSLHIAGTASPEGPYDNNVYLAKNRTAALKDYVQNLYKFPEGFITTSYEPVDWKGLREWLENSNLENKDKILAIVNSDIEPYARNSKIKKDFPTQYQFLLKQVYPSLRHSDYVIDFTIRQFTDIAEIAELIKTAPQKLSLGEMYRLAATYEPGSNEYNDVFEVAVRMYPNDEGANLNAANAAMICGDLYSAQRYLDKAGDNDKSRHARTILEKLKEIKQSN